MPSRCCEFVDSRLRRSPPDRASAVPYGQAGENAMRFPHLVHRSAAAHKRHSTPQQHGMILISGNGETSSRLDALAYSSPEAVQTTGTVANSKAIGEKPHAFAAVCQRERAYSSQLTPRGREVDSNHRYRSAIATELQGTGVRTTLRWREMDSNFRFRARCGFGSENFAV